MGIKFTHVKKWDDVWFSNLSMEQKVMFIYICDMCDIAGFLEVNERLASFHTGIDDVRGTIESLSKSVVYKNGYVWVKKHLKHQRNLPLNSKNKAHIAIAKIINEYSDKFPEVYEYLPDEDVNVVIELTEKRRGINPPCKGDTSPPSISISNSISNSKSNNIIKEVINNESLIPKLYKYFIGEENLMGAGIPTGTRTILAEAIDVMDVETWKGYCEARLKDEYKAAPRKFFLEDGWRKYQLVAKAKQQEKQRVKSRRKEAEKRKSLPNDEPPAEFKEFVKSFGKRRKLEGTNDSAS